MLRWPRRVNQMQKPQSIFKPNNKLAMISFHFGIIFCLLCCNFCILFIIQWQHTNKFYCVLSSKCKTSFMFFLLLLLELLTKYSNLPWMNAVCILLEIFHSILWLWVSRQAMLLSLRDQNDNKKDNISFCLPLCCNYSYYSNYS